MHSPPFDGLEHKSETLAGSFSGTAEPCPDAGLDLHALTSILVAEA
jgi:hypothetical protein